MDRKQNSNRFTPFKYTRSILQSKKKTAIAILVIAILGFFGWKTFAQTSQRPQYQTAQVERGTLVSSVTASGTISSASSANITTQASGVVKEVYVQNGDYVVSGQNIATLNLDQTSSQRQASAYTSYLSAVSSLNAAKSKMNSLQSALFKANQAFVTDRGINNPTDQQKADPKYIQEQADWLQAEADYNNQAGVISVAQASLTSASLSLAQVSSTITAPISGTVSNLTLTPGLPIASSQTASDTTNSSSQTVGSIKLEGAKTQANVSLTEIDVINIKRGQKVTLTLDAFPDKTFTGKVATIDTNGIVASGVTTYPTVIDFDQASVNIYPNMAVSAKIITRVKDNVLLVPSQAVQTQNGQKSVRILRNGQVTSIPVETGESSDTQTEIVSGLSEGQEVIINIIAQSGGAQQGSRSPFGGTGGFGGLRPGGGFRGGGGGGENH